MHTHTHTNTHTHTHTHTHTITHTRLLQEEGVEVEVEISPHSVPTDRHCHMSNRLSQAHVTAQVHFLKRIVRKQL